MLRRTIKRGGVGVLSSDSNKHEKISYCQKCLKVKTLSILKHRIYLDDTGKINPNPPPDSKNWQQCWTCGLIVAVREIKQEADLETFTEPTDSPFKSTLVQSVKDTGIQSRKFDRSRTGKTQHHQRKHERIFKQDLDQYKEEDIKQALKKGAKLLNYSERS